MFRDALNQIRNNIKYVRGIKSRIGKLGLYIDVLSKWC